MLPSRSPPFKSSSAARPVWLSILLTGSVFEASVYTMKATFQASIVRGVIVPHPAYAGAVAAKLARFKPGTLTVTVESAVKRLNPVTPKG